MVKRATVSSRYINECYDAVKRDEGCKSKRHYSANRISDTLDGIRECNLFALHGLGVTAVVLRDETYNINFRSNCRCNTQRGRTKSDCKS